MRVCRQYRIELRASRAGPRVVRRYPCWNVESVTAEGRQKARVETERLDAATTSSDYFGAWLRTFAK